MRVTVGMSAYTSITNIQNAETRLAKLQNELSSGKSILTPSDNPTGTVQALQLRGALARNSSYATSQSDALSWLSAADTAYSQIVSTTQQARTLVLQALNTGASDTASQQTLSQQISDLRTGLLRLANTTYDGRPLFGGTTAGGVAYDSSGNYVGDTGQVARGIAQNTTVGVSAVGSTVFGSGSTDLFATLQNISAAISANPSAPALSGALSSLDAAISRVSSAQASAGATYQQVQLAQTNSTSQATALTGQLSSVEDADMADLAIKVTTANTAYQAALQTTASVGQLSLLDFLK